MQILKTGTPAATVYDLSEAAVDVLAIRKKLIPQEVNELELLVSLELEGFPNTTVDDVLKYWKIHNYIHGLTEKEARALIIDEAQRQGIILSEHQLEVNVYRPWLWLW